MVPRKPDDALRVHPLQNKPSCRATTYIHEELHISQTGIEIPKENI